MGSRRQTTRPKPWAEYRTELSSTRFLLLHGFNWGLSWAAWALGNWVLLDVLEHLGSFSILIAVIFYFADSGNRLKQKHYQAWQVINTAQGKGGSGGRVEALQELNADHVSLVGIDASGASLQGIALPNGSLSRCDLHASDLRNSNFRNASLSFCNLQNANFRSANLASSRMDDVALQGADLHGATLDGATLAHADLSGVDLREAHLRDVAWGEIASLRLANLWGVRNAPPGFVNFALEHDAVSLESDAQWAALTQAAVK